MTIQVKCSCGKILQAPDKLAGKKARCPKCQRSVAIPSDEPDEDVDYEVSAKARPKPRYVDEDDDDDDDDRPRKKRVDRGSSLVLICVLGGIAALLVLAGGGAVGAYFLFFKKPSTTQASSSSSGSDAVASTSFAAHQRYLPEKSAMVLSMNNVRVRASSLDKELNASSSSASDKTTEMLGLSDDDLERTTITMNKDGMLAIVSIRKEINLDEVARKNNWKTVATVGKYNVYDMANGPMSLMASPEGHILLAGAPVSLFQEILQRDRMPNLSDGFKQAIEQTDFSRCCVMVWATDKSRDSGPRGNDPPYLKESTGGFIERDMTSDYSMKKTILFKDEATAERFKQAVETEAKSQRDKFGAGNMETTVSGTRVIVKFSLTADDAKARRQRLKSWTNSLSDKIP